MREFIGDRLCPLVNEGNSVVFVDPLGENGPLYRRDHYRRNQARWRVTTGYVPDKQVKW